MFHREKKGRNELMVCTNISCMLKGGYGILKHIEGRLGIKAGETTPDGAFSIVEEECLAACANAPMMICGDEYFLDLTPEKVDAVAGRPAQALPRAAAERARSTGRIVGRRPGRGEGLVMAATWQESKGVKIVTKNFGVADSHKLSVYQQRGGYEGLRQALTLQPAALVDEVKKSNLRGRGGAGFPTGMKWSFIPKDAKQVYLVVNADESEPGTCKDRELLAFDPHLLIEGMLIASYALGCKHAYIYIRGEMMREAKIVQAAIDEAYAAGWLGKDTRRSAAAARSSWTSRCTAAPARTSAARRRRCSTRSRASAAGRASSRRSRRSRASSTRRRWSTTSRRS